MKQKTIAIIHFNTPELTEAGIKSLRKHGGEDYRVVVFDNSATLTLPDGKVIQARPFTVKMDGVEVIDNTRGQVIDFDKFLAEHPDRNPSVGIYKSSVWGSAKHIVTVQKLWELLPEPFSAAQGDHASDCRLFKGDAAVKYAGVGGNSVLVCKPEVVGVQILSVNLRERAVLLDHKHILACLQNCIQLCCREFCEMLYEKLHKKGLVVFFVLLQLTVAEFTALDFAGEGLWKFRYELDCTRVLVRCSRGFDVVLNLLNQSLGRLVSLV